MATAALWELGYRADSETTRNNLHRFTALRGSANYSWLHTHFGARLSTSLKDIDELEYKLECAFLLTPFLEIDTRLAHQTLLPNTISSTHFLGLLKISAAPFGSWKLFAGVGWYERQVALSKATLFPATFKNSYREHDFALELGTQIGLTADLNLLGRVATFEEISIYNLNNPYAHVELNYHLQPMDWVFSLYGRYQVLLGFGRMDRFSVGIQAKFGTI